MTLPARLCSVCLSLVLVVLLPRCGSTPSSTDGGSGGGGGQVGGGAGGGGGGGGGADGGGAGGGVGGGVGGGAGGGVGGGGATGGGGGDDAGAGGGGGDDAGTTTDGGTDAGTSSDGGIDAGSCLPNQGTVLAMQTITFGETSGTAWRTLGVNLDGKSSTGVSTDVCQPAAGGSPNVAYPDGDNGIDNSFGKNVLPTLQAINPNWVSLLNNDISGGQATALMKLLCLPPSGDVPLLVSKVFNATPMPLGMQPQWLGSDAWPVRPELLQDVNDAESSALVFPSGSITGSTFNAGPGGTFVLNFPLQGPSASMELHLVIHDAHVTMTLDSSRTGATAGVIGGVLDTEELVLEFRKLGVLMGACGNPVLANVITQVRQASDIQADGGQDPTVTCDGISIGVGFTMGPAMLGGVGPFLDGGALCP